MKTSKSTCSSKPSPLLRHKPSGFTLVELLVVIFIIAVLATLAFVGYSRVRVSAAKATTISNLRQVHLGVLMWASDNNRGDPFYGANGTASYSHEGAPGPNAKLAPANPATALYDRDSPGDGYVTDHTLFFSPLMRYTPPALEDYHPEAADTEHLWGTFAWYYPSKPYEDLSTRQQNAMYEWAPREYSRAVNGKLLMATDYLNCEPKWDKIYIALMLDGSAINVGTGDRAWIKWLYTDPT